MSETPSAVCFQVERAAGSLPPNQQTEPEEETQGGAYDLPGNPPYVVRKEYML